MPLSGPRAAPSAQLRAQLRLVLLGLRASRVLQRQTFATGRLLREEETVQAERPQPVIRTERRYNQRHIYPNGRIIGKPGRRQRAASEQLAIPSLGKPSEVIVLRDVVEDRKARAPAIIPQEPTGTENTEPVHVVQGLQEGILADADEAFASIDNLRPHNSIVGRQELKRLEEQLLEGYNLKQLTSYLVLSFGQRTGEQHAVAESATPGTLHATSWQSGRTPLEERVGRVSLEARGRGKSKVSVAKQILRLAWRLSTEAEAQELGELEVYVRPWQLALLFDVSRYQKSVKDIFIDSPLLTRNSDVRPYRKGNVVRITARKGDALEVMSRLQQGLARVQRDEIDLTVFEPLLGQPGWPSSLADLFTQEDLQFISERTKSTFEYDRECRLAIYSAEATAAVSAHTKRLLLGLLNLPSATVRLEMSDTEDGHKDSPSDRYWRALHAAKEIEYPVMNAHRRLQSEARYRKVTPIAALGGKQTSDAGSPDIARTHDPHEWQPATTMLVKKLGSTNLPDRPGLLDVTNDNANAAWSLENPLPDWSARFGVLLHNRKTVDEFASPDALAKPSEDSASRSALFLEQTMGLTELLQHFTTVRKSQEVSNSDETTSSSPRSLVAHLTPSPYTRLGVGAVRDLPRVTVEFETPNVARSYHVRGPAAQVLSVAATSDRQELDVALPSQIGDLSFSRERTVTLKGDAWQSNGQIGKLVRKIQTCLSSPHGGLPAMFDINIDLPPFLVGSALQSGRAAAEAPALTVPYFLSHYEEIVSVDLVPLRDEVRLALADPKVRELAEGWPEGMVLRCREVDAGAFGGRRTEATLHPPSSDARGLDEETAHGVGMLGGIEASDPALVKTAVRFLRLMTRANAGQLGTSEQEDAKDLETAHVGRRTAGEGRAATSVIRAVGSGPEPGQPRRVTT